MTDFEYTKEFDVNSSWVEGVYYNENDKTLVLDLDDEMYRYENVPADAVGALVEARETDGSVGAYYNTVFSPKFGPAEYLGRWVDVDGYEVIPNVAPGGVKKDFTNASIMDRLRTDIENVTNVPGPSLATKEFSLQDPAQTKVEAPTKEFSLKTPETAVPQVDSDVTTTLYFTLDGGDKVYDFVHEGEFEDAVEELNSIVSRVNAKGRLTKAVLDFA